MQFFILIDEQRRGNALEFIRSLNIRKPYSIEIKEYRKNRSTAQNRLYWSWLRVLSAFTGYGDDELHELFKIRLLGTVEKKIMGDTIKIPRSTTSLTTREFTEYLEKIELAAMTMGVSVPHPDDYGYIMERSAA